MEGTLFLQFFSNPSTASATIIFVRRFVNAGTPVSVILIRFWITVNILWFLYDRIVWVMLNR